MPCLTASRCRSVVHTGAIFAGLDGTCCSKNVSKRWACCTRLVGVRHSAPYRNRAPRDMSPAPRARFCRYLRSQHSAAHLQVRGGLACTWYIPCLDSCTQSLQTYACRAVSATTVRKKVPAQFKKVELCLPRDPMPLQGVWVGFQDGNQLRSR